MQAGLSFKNSHLVLSWLQETLKVTASLGNLSFLSYNLTKGRRRTAAFSVRQLVFMTSANLNSLISLILGFLEKDTYSKLAFWRKFRGYAGMHGQ